MSLVRRIENLRPEECRDEIFGYSEARDDAIITVKPAEELIMNEMKDAIESLLSWCEEIAGDNVDEDAAKHEENTVAYAKAQLEKYKRLMSE